MFHREIARCSNSARFELTRCSNSARTAAGNVRQARNRPENNPARLRFAADLGKSSRRAFLGSPAIRQQRFLDCDHFGGHFESFSMPFKVP